VPGGFVTPPEMVVLGALPLAFKTHAAIMHLCRLGYREDAEARLRTLFELALDVRYMLQAEDPQDCAQRWLDYATVVQHKFWGVLNRGDDYYDEVRRELANRSKEMQENLDAIERVKAGRRRGHVGAEAALCVADGGDLELTARANRRRCICAHGAVIRAWSASRRGRGVGRIRVSIRYVGDRQVVATVKPQWPVRVASRARRPSASPPMAWPCSCGAPGPIKKHVAPKGSALTFWVGVYLAAARLGDSV